MALCEGKYGKLRHKWYIHNIVDFHISWISIDIDMNDSRYKYSSICCMFVQIRSKKPYVICKISKQEYNDEKSSTITTDIIPLFLFMLLIEIKMLQYDQNDNGLKIWQRNHSSSIMQNRFIHKYTNITYFDQKMKSSKWTEMAQLVAQLQIQFSLCFYSTMSLRLNKLQ